MQKWKPGKSQLTEFDIKLGAILMKDKQRTGEAVKAAVHHVDRVITVMLLIGANHDKTDPQINESKRMGKA